MSSHVCNLLLPAPTAPTTAGTTFTRLIPHNLQGFLNLFTVLFMNSVMPWWSNIHNNLFLDKNNVRFSGFNTQGLLRYTSYIGTNDRPVGSCFAPFWSENGYTLCPLCSGIGYAFRGNYESVWTYLSFQFQMIKIDSYGLFSWLCINIVRRKLVGTLSDVCGLMGLIERRRYLNTMKLYLKQRVWQAPFEPRKLPCSKRRGMSGTLAFSGVGCSCVSYEESKCISEACLPLQCEDGFFL